MNPEARGISWEGPEHHHLEKGSDWFWVVGILSVALTAVAILFGNLLLGLLILLASGCLILINAKPPRVIPYAVTTRGLRVDNQLFPHTTLESFYIDEDDPRGPQLLAKSKHLFAPLIVIPLPEEALEEIEAILASKLPEEHLEEPFLNKLLEFFGF